MKLDIFTDAAKSLGFAAVLGNKWLQGVFGKNEKDLHISVLELNPILVGLEVWSEILANMCLVVHCDNNAVVHMINKQSSKNESTMSVQCMRHNIIVKA